MNTIEARKSASKDRDIAMKALMADFMSFPEYFTSRKGCSREKDFSTLRKLSTESTHKAILERMSVIADKIPDDDELYKLGRQEYLDEML